MSTTKTTSEPKANRKSENSEFLQGFAVAIGTVIRDGSESGGVDAMDSNGVSLADLIAAGAEEFDLKPIRAEYKLQGRKPDGSDKFVPRRCRDCDKAAAQAYSDGTTPGFFSPKCSRHRNHEGAAGGLR